MMKKQTYMKPTMLVVKIKTTGMLANSPIGTSVSNTEAETDALGRKGGFLDDYYDE